MIGDARNWNLFLTEFMLICAKMGWLKFSSLNDFRLTFGHLSFFLSLSTWLLDRFNFLPQIASSSSSTMLVYLSFFQNFSVRSKKFIAAYRDPDSLKCKPFWLKCLLVICRYLIVPDGLLIIFPLSDHNVGVKIYTLQAGNFSCVDVLKLT